MAMMMVMSTTTVTARQTGQIALYTLSLLLATLGIGARLWARRIIGTRWQVDDWLMVLAYLSLIGLVICSNLAVTVGHLGVHELDIPETQRRKILSFNLKMTLLLPLFMICSSFLAKLSITHFYTTLFPRSSASSYPIHALCRLQMYLLSLAFLATFTACFLMCRPFGYTWNKEIRGGQCFDVRSFWFWSSIVALFFDLTCVLLPTPVFWALKTTWRKKCQLIVLFGLGGFICILTAFRIYYDYRIDLADLSYTAAPAVMYTVPEPSLSIVVGCLPITMPLWKRASGSIRSMYTTMASRQWVGTKAEELQWSTRTSVRWSTETGMMRRLTGHLYPSSAVVVSPGHTNVDFNRSKEGMDGDHPSYVRQRDVVPSSSGITVLKEVHVDSKPRADFGATHNV